MARSTQKQVQRESLERELQEVRSAIRTLREAPEAAQPDQGALFQLERAEEREIQLLQREVGTDCGTRERLVRASN